MKIAIIKKKHVRGLKLKSVLNFIKAKIDGR